MFHSCIHGRLDEARVRRMLSPDRRPEPDVRQYIQDCVRPNQPVRTPLRIPPNPALGIESRVYFQVRHEDEILGTILVFDPDYLVEEAALPAITHAADQAAQIIRYERVLWDPDRSREHDLLAAILFSDEETRKRAAKEARRTGFIEAGPVAVLIASVDDDSDAPTRLAEAAEDLRSVLDAGSFLMAESDSELQILVSLGHSMTPVELRALPDQLRAASRHPILLGMGSIQSEAASAPDSLSEARLAHSVAGRSPFDGVAVWSELGALRLLLQLPKPRNGDIRLVPEIDILSREQPVLFRTLECFLQNAGHSQAAAQELFIHRATLHYRLRKIEEITHRSLDSGEDRLELHLAVKQALFRGSPGT